MYEPITAAEVRAERERTGESLMTCKERLARDRMEGALLMAESAPSLDQLAIMRTVLLAIIRKEI